VPRAYKAIEVPSKALRAWQEAIGRQGEEWGSVPVCRQRFAILQNSRGGREPDIHCDWEFRS